MIVTIASGKGGTGKTTLAVNLALARSEKTQLLDCDVEEPNCHIFLRPEIEKVEKAYIPVPEIDQSLCDGCGKCADFCRFNALACVKSKPLIFAELCHGCGGCAMVCPQKAISEIKREIGIVEKGNAGNLKVALGRLNIGEAMAPPLIKAVKKAGENFDGWTIIDAPPGTSCPVIAAIRDSDYVVLVTEPTPFGLNDLKLAVAMVRALKIPFGVVINRAGIGNDQVENYCREESIEILARIPNDRRIAELYSRGRELAQKMPAVGRIMQNLLNNLLNKTLT